MMLRSTSAVPGTSVVFSCGHDESSATPEDGGEDTGVGSELS